MKRLLAATILAAGLIASAPCARASTTTTGGAQLQWKASASLTLAIVTQYSGAFAQGNAVPTLLPSIAGVCAGGPAEANFTLSFGSLNYKPGTSTACLYKNALAVSVQSNDASGFVVNEYMDAAPSVGVGFCAFPNGAASFPIAPAIGPVPASTQSGNPAAGTYAGNVLSSCAGSGRVIPTGSGGASSGGSVPGNPGTPGLEFYSPSATALTIMSMAGPTLSGGAIVSMYAAEDIQVNLGPGANSLNSGVSYLTIQLVPN
ncbi:MAG: hypothetical protein QOF71_2074 [Candidatus Eremiobacteraeota bacterium]|nr:hypothetical protein [Candidatus Eremiobacteraeota bacterium]